MNAFSTIPKVPTKENVLRSWIQGAELDRWADESQDKVISAADKLMEDMLEMVGSVKRERGKVELLKESELLPEETTLELERYLDNRAEKALGMLEKLVNVRGKLTAVSQAILIAAVQKPAVVMGPGSEDSNGMRDANPRRRLTTVDIMD